MSEAALIMFCPPDTQCREVNMVQPSVCLLIKKMKWLAKLKHCNRSRRASFGVWFVNSCGLSEFILSFLHIIVHKSAEAYYFNLK